MNNTGTITNIGTNAAATATISATIGSNVVSVSQAGALLPDQQRLCLDRDEQYPDLHGHRVWTISGAISGAQALTLQNNSTTGGIMLWSSQ